MFTKELKKGFLNGILLIIKVSILLSTFYTFVKGGIEYSCILRKKGTLTDVYLIANNVTGVDIYYEEGNYIGVLDSRMKLNEDGRPEWGVYNKKEEKFYYVECYVEDITFAEYNPNTFIEVSFKKDYFHTYLHNATFGNLGPKDKIISNCYFAVYDEDCKLGTKNTNRFYLSFIVVLAISTFIYLITVTGVLKFISLCVDLKYFYYMVEMVIIIFKLLNIDCGKRGLYCYNKTGLIYYSSSKNKVLKYSLNSPVNVTAGFDSYKEHDGVFVILNGDLYFNGVLIEILEDKKPSIISALRDIFWYNEFFNYPAVFGSHCLSVEQMIEKLKDGGSFIVCDDENNSYKGLNNNFYSLYCDKKLPKDLINNLEIHYKFFLGKGKMNIEALNRAMCARIRFFDKPENCGNSAWKMYCSDVKRIYKDYGFEIFGCDLRAPTTAYQKIKQDKSILNNYRNNCKSNDQRIIVCLNELDVLKIENKKEQINLDIQLNNGKDIIALNKKKSKENEKEVKCPEEVCYENFLKLIKENKDFPLYLEHKKYMNKISLRFKNLTMDLNTSVCNKIVKCLNVVKLKMKRQNKGLPFLQCLKSEDLNSFNKFTEGLKADEDFFKIVDKFDDLTVNEYFQLEKYLKKEITDRYSALNPPYIEEIRNKIMDDIKLNKWFVEKTSEYVKKFGMYNLMAHLGIKEPNPTEKLKLQALDYTQAEEVGEASSSIVCSDSVKNKEAFKAEIIISNKSVSKILHSLCSDIEVKKLITKKRKNNNIRSEQNVEVKMKYINKEQSIRFVNLKTKKEENDNRKGFKLVKPANVKSSKLNLINNRFGSNISFLLNLFTVFSILGIYPGRNKTLEMIKNSSEPKRADEIKVKSIMRKVAFKAVGNELKTGGIKVVHKSGSENSNLRVNKNPKSKEVNKSEESNINKKLLRQVSAYLLIDFCCNKFLSLEEVENYIRANKDHLEKDIVSKCEKLQ